MIAFKRSHQVLALLLIGLSAGYALQGDNVCRDSGEETCCEGYEQSEDGQSCVSILSTEENSSSQEKKRSPTANFSKKRNARKKRDYDGNSYSSYEYLARTNELPSREREYVPESIEARHHYPHVESNSNYIPESIERGGYAPVPEEPSGNIPESLERGGYISESAERGGYVPESAERGGYVAESAERGSVPVPEDHNSYVPESVEIDARYNYGSESDESESSEVYNFASGEDESRAGNLRYVPDVSADYYLPPLYPPPPPPRPVFVGLEKGECPDEFVELHGTGCYHFSKEKLPYSIASQHCTELGGYLAEVESHRENEALKRIISIENDNHHLLGATDSDEEGRWIWQHSRSPMIFEDWFRGEPNNYANQDCLVISDYDEFNYQWDDISCSYSLHYVCETDERTTTSTEIETSSSEWDCPEGFTKEGCETCYQIVQTPMDWYEATSACEQLNGYLGKIENEVENNAVTKMISDLGNVEVYIGGNDIESEGTWKWVDGKPVSFTNWGPGEPNDQGGEDCITIKGQGHGPYSEHWNDASCYDRNYFLCQTDHRVSKKIIIEGEECPDEYVNLEGQGCYHFSTYDEANWYDAEDRCKSLGGFLVSIETEEENNAIRSYIESGKKNFFIGANDIAYEGRWIDSVGKSVQFTDWGEGEPNNANEGEDCAVLKGNGFNKGRWNDDSCYNEFSYICETHLRRKDGFIPHGNGNNCPVDFELVDGQCYLFASDDIAMTWDDANNYCETKDSYLAEMDSPEEGDALKEHMKYSYYSAHFVGGKGQGTIDTWTWAKSGKSINFWTTFPEMYGFPRQELCMVMAPLRSPDWVWSTMRCDEQNSFICETEASVVEIPEKPTSNHDCNWPFKAIGYGCYYVGDTQENWWVAAETCHEKEGHLITLDDSTENKIIRNYLQGESMDHVWIGAYDLGHEGQWVLDRSRKPMVFSDWAKHEPNNHEGNQHCAALKEGIDYRWDDADCLDEYYFMCESDPIAPMPTLYYR